MVSEERKEHLVLELYKYRLRMILTLQLEGNGYSVLGLIFFFFLREFNSCIYIHNSGPLSKELITF